MKMINKYLLLIIIVIFGFTGCSLFGKKDSTEKPKKYKVKKYHISSDLEKYSPQRVAVLPFDVPQGAREKIEKKREKLEKKLEKEKNKETKDEQKILQIQESLTSSALEKTINWKKADDMRDIFAKSFSGKRYSDVEYFLIQQKLKERGCVTKRDIINVEPQFAGKILNADALIQGELIRYTQLYLILASIKTVKLHTKMVSVRDGKILWEATHSKTSATGSAPTSIIGAVVTIFDVVLHFFNIDIKDFTFKMCEEIVATIPDDFITEEIIPPRIDLFKVEKPNKTLAVGEKIKFVLEGDPFSLASCKIDGIDKIIEMDEDEKNPGKYHTEYIVQKGDNISAANVTAFLISAQDKKTSTNWVERAGINIDTTPPAIPTNIKVKNLETEIALNWEPSGESDIAGYKIYRSEDNVSGFKMISESQSSEYKDKNIVLNKPFSYKISSYDTLGNESEPSEIVEGIPLKPGPTKVTNDIKNKVIWYKECSPYIISSPIKIEKTGTLTIKPGTIIRADGGGIEVLGTLICEGSKSELIVFESTKRKGYPEWGGIYFNQSIQGSIVKTVIKNAQNGITIKGCSPIIKSSRIEENVVGIKITGPASPEISLSSIKLNGKDGVVIEKASPTIKETDITENVQNGIFIDEGSNPKIFNCDIYNNQFFEVFSLSEEIIDLKDNFWGELQENEFFTEVWGKINIPSYLPKQHNYELSNPYKFQPLHPDQAEYTKLEEAARWSLKTSPEEAREKFLQLLNPQNSVSGQIFKWLGIIEKEANHTPKAVEYLRKALLIEPNNDGIHYLLGECYIDMNKTDEAIQSLKKAIDLNPNYEAARKKLKEISNQK